jgi:hypothetical protein
LILFILSNLFLPSLCVLCVSVVIFFRMTLLRLAIAVVLLGLFAGRAGYFAAVKSQTFDEGAHLVAGVSYWRTGDFRINPEHPPLLKLLWAIPAALRADVPFDPDPDAWEKKDHWRLADAFLYDGPVSHHDLLFEARLVNVALGVLLVALIGWWGHRLWGPNAGLLVLALAATDPNVIAFAALLSMDLGLALFATAAGFALWEYSATGRRLWFVLAGVALGLALAAKFSALVTVAGLGLGALGYVAGGGWFAVPGAAAGPTVRTRLGGAVTAFVRLGLVAVAVVVVCYGVIHGLDWARGLKQQLVRGDLGDPHYFLNGEISSTGWWTYFVHVLAIKTPPGTLILAAAAVAAWRRGRRVIARDVAFLFAPAVVYFLAMSASRIDIGWRVLLPAYPALILLAARSATLIPETGAGRAAGWGIVVGLVLPVVAEFRHLGKELSYANGLYVSRADLHEHLSDSNIDWGQGLGALSARLREDGEFVIYFSYAGTVRPEAHAIRCERLPGWGMYVRPTADRVDPAGRVFVAVSVSNLQGTYLRDPTTYHWLRAYEPVSRTDDSIWLFDVTGDAAAIERLRALAR